MRANASAAQAGAQTGRLRRFVDTRDERGLLGLGCGVDPHRRAPLAAVREQRRDLAIEVSVDAFEMIDAAGLEQQERLRTVRREILVGEEVRVARGDDAVDGQPSRFAMIGMQAVRLPGIVTEHDVGLHLADRGADLGSRSEIVYQLAVDAAQEAHVDRAEDLGSVALLVFASRHQCGEIGVRVPRSLGAVGAHAEVHLGARVGPFRQRRRTPELDVVGVGADREDAAGDREIDLSRHDVGSVVTASAVVSRRRLRGSCASASRSDSSSTSKPNARSSTMRTFRPSRRASAA